MASIVLSSSRDWADFSALITDVSLSEAFEDVMLSSVVIDEVVVTVFSSSLSLLCSSTFDHSDDTACALLKCEEETSSPAIFESNLCGGGGGGGGGGSTPPAPAPFVIANLMHIKSAHKCSCCRLLGDAIFIAFSCTAHFFSHSVTTLLMLSAGQLQTSLKKCKVHELSSSSWQSASRVTCYISSFIWGAHRCFTARTAPR